MTKILVVEDEPNMREALTFLLRSEGYEVLEAEDGEQAVSLFTKEGADLILLDLMLPKLSGKDVCKAIRTTSDVPVIMLTAKDTEIDKVIGFEIGADDYTRIMDSNTNWKYQSSCCCWRWRRWWWIISLICKYPIISCQYCICIARHLHTSKFRISK